MTVTQQQQKTEYLIPTEIILGNGSARAIEGEVDMKEWMCVQVKHNKDVGETLKRFQKNGWSLQTYTCAQMRPGLEINHYLLFEKGE